VSRTATSGTDPKAADTILHASCVALNGQGVLILGSSGAGKSSLALELMALGADLVADDRTCLLRRGGEIIASAPHALAGMIEARGVGLLKAKALPEVSVSLVVDLDQIEIVRLPIQRTITLLTCKVPLIHGVATNHFPAIILQYIKGGGIV
jgi:HPr kinase/phosphorylase